MESPDGYREYIQGPGDYGITGTRRWYDLSGREQDAYLLGCFLGEPTRADNERSLGLFDRPADSIAEALLGPFFDRDPLTGLSRFVPENASVSERVFARRVLTIGNSLLGQRLLKAYGRASLGTRADQLDSSAYLQDPLLFFESVAPVKGMEVLAPQCLEDLDVSMKRQEDAWELLSANERAEAIQESRFRVHQVDRDATGAPVSLYRATGTLQGVPRAPVPPPERESLLERAYRFIGALFG